MKKIVLILTLFLTSQVWAEEEGQLNFSKFIKFVNSDVQFSKNVQMIKDFFEYEFGNCDNVFRATMAVKLPNDHTYGLTEQEFTANMITELQSQLKTKLENEFNKKYTNINLVGPCIIANLKVDLYEIKDQSNKKAWKAFQEISYDLGFIDGGPNIRQLTRWPYVEENKNRTHTSGIDSYLGRKRESKWICSDISRLISANKLIEMCKEQLNITEAAKTSVVEVR